MIKNKNITVLADFDTSGGTRTYFKWLISYLTKRNNVTIVFFKYQYDEDISAYFKHFENYNLVFLPNYLKRGFLFKVFRKLKMQPFFDNINDFFITRYCIKKIPTDIFFISQGGGSHYFSFLLSQKQVYITMHSLTTSHLFATVWEKPLQKKLKKYGLQTNHIISVSQFAKNRFIQNCTLTDIEKNCITIYNHGGSIRDAHEKNIHLHITVLTLGHLVGYKNPALWLAIAKAVTSEIDIPTEFIWAGEGFFYDELQREAVNYKNIHFLGYRTDIQNLYANADIYFQPSTLENCSISVLDALKYGVPCIVSSVGGLPEQITDGYNGFVCELEFKQMKTALCTLISDAVLRDQMGNNARKQFEETFTAEQWEKNMDELGDYT